MNEASWTRWAPASGIIYSVLSVLGLLLIAFEEVDTKTDAEILAHYADGGNRTTEIVGFLLLAVGVQFLLLFAGTLRSRLRSVGPEALNTLAVAATATAAGMFASAAALFVSTAAAAEFIDAYAVDPDLARFAFGAGYVFLIAWVITMLASVIAISVLALRTSVLPTWLGWAGFAVAILALIEAWLFPIFVIPAWVVLVALVLIIHEPADDQQGRP